MNRLGAHATLEFACLIHGAIELWGLLGAILRQLYTWRDWQHVERTHKQSSEASPLRVRQHCLLSGRHCRLMRKHEPAPLDYASASPCGRLAGDSRQGC